MVVSIFPRSLNFMKIIYLSGQELSITVDGICPHSLNFMKIIYLTGQELIIMVVGIFPYALNFMKIIYFTGQKFSITVVSIFSHCRDFLEKKQLYILQSVIRKLFFFKANLYNLPGHVHHGPGCFPQKATQPSAGPGSDINRKVCVVHTSAFVFLSNLVLNGPLFLLVLNPKASFLLQK